MIKYFVADFIICRFIYMTCSSQPIT